MIVYGCFDHMNEAPIYIEVWGFLEKSIDKSCAKVLVCCRYLTNLFTMVRETLFTSLCAV